jgi:hypothetical protein
MPAGASEPIRLGTSKNGYDQGVPEPSAVERGPSSDDGETDPSPGIAEPEALVDGAEDEADKGSRLSTVASDPPASWAGPDVPPANRQR